MLGGKGNRVEDTPILLSEAALGSRGKHFSLHEVYLRMPANRRGGLLNRLIFLLQAELIKTVASIYAALQTGQNTETNPNKSELSLTRFSPSSMQQPASAQAHLGCWRNR
jgi:hypothetical protein